MRFRRSVTPSRRSRNMPRPATTPAGRRRFWAEGSRSWTGAAPSRGREGRRGQKPASPGRSQQRGSPATTAVSVVLQFSVIAPEVELTKTPAAIFSTLAPAIPETVIVPLVHLFVVASTVTTVGTATFHLPSGVLPLPASTPILWAILASSLASGSMTASALPILRPAPSGQMLRQFTSLARLPGDRRARDPKIFEGAPLKIRETAAELATVSYRFRKKRSENLSGDRWSLLV